MADCRDGRAVEHCVPPSLEPPASALAAAILYERFALVGLGGGASAHARHVLSTDDELPAAGIRARCAVGFIRAV